MKPRPKASRKQPKTAPRTADQRTVAAPPHDWRQVAAGAVLVLMVFVAYAPLATAGFIWDDDNYVLDNLALRTVNGLVRIWLDTSTERQYYPLVHTTYWIEYHLWGLRPFGYHLVNVLLHATSAVLVWRLLTVLQVPGAWLAAAIFAVHPVEVESVAWVTERKNVLSLALALASMLAYLHFSPAEAVGSAAPPSKRSWRWYILSFLLFVLALFSKTVVSSLPAVLLVIFWWRGLRDWRRSFWPFVRRDVLPLVPFFLVGAGMGSLTARLEELNVGAVGKEWDFGALDRILIAGRVWWFYATKLVWPYPLIFFYPHWDIQYRELWQYVFPLAVLATVAALAALWLMHGRIGRGPLAAVLIFAGVLFPALGFFNVYPFRYSFVADHFQYHASLAIISLLAAGAAMAAARLPERLQKVAQVAAGVVLLVLTGLTFAQSRVYHDLDTLYLDTIAKNPAGWTAYSNLAVVVEGRGDHEKAHELFQKAVELRPNDATMISNMGHIRLKLGSFRGFEPGELNEIEKLFLDALELDPIHVPARRGLAYAFFHERRFDEALHEFAITLEARPGEPDSLVGMGEVLAEEGKQDRAEECFRRAIAVNPAYADAYRGLARLRVAQGRPHEAIRFYEDAVRVMPFYIDAHLELATLLHDERNYPAAAKHLSTVVQLNPRYVAGWDRLGIVLGRMGNLDKAIECFQKALNLDPDSADAKSDLAHALDLKAQRGSNK